MEFLNKVVYEAPTVKDVLVCTEMNLLQDSGKIPQSVRQDYESEEW